MFLLYSIMQETYFDDDSGEVVISSLRLGDDQGRYVLRLGVARTLESSYYIESVSR